MDNNYGQIYQAFTEKSGRWCIALVKNQSKGVRKDVVANRACLDYGEMCSEPLLIKTDGRM